MGGGSFGLSMLSVFALHSFDGFVTAGFVARSRSLPATDFGRFAGVSGAASSRDRFADGFRACLLDAAFAVGYMLVFAVSSSAVSLAYFNFSPRRLHAGRRGAGVSDVVAVAMFVWPVDDLLSILQPLHVIERLVKTCNIFGEASTRDRRCVQLCLRREGAWTLKSRVVTTAG